MKYTRTHLVVMTCAMLAAGTAFAQTTVPGPTIDVEIINPADGSNVFCVAPSEILTSQVFLRPGTDTTSCTLNCSPPDVAGGSANLSTAVIDIAFDESALSYVADSMTSNPLTAAAQGLPQDNTTDGRIGWALAGNWNTPGNPGSGLRSPCEMQILTTANWLFQMEFQAVGAGMSNLHLRRETDARPFTLSFADICGSTAFRQSNSGIDEVKDALVLVNESCLSSIFFDNFEIGDPNRWSAVIVEPSR